MRLSQLLGEKRTIEAEFEGDTLTLTYDPSAYTAEAEDRYMAARETQRNIGSLVEALLVLLINWDLVDEEGATVPIDRETLRSLPGKFLNDCMDAINEDSAPKKTKGKNSRGG